MPSSKPERRTATSIADAEAVVRENRPEPPPVDFAGVVQELVEGRVPFDPVPHLIKVQGRDYLPVYARLMWMRHDHGTSWGIETELTREQEGFVSVRAIVRDRSPIGLPGKDSWAYEELPIIATGLASAPILGKFPALMKAETAAIGRALAHAGFGTQWIEEEDDVVDSPRSAPAAPAAPVATMLFRDYAKDPVELEIQMREDLDLISEYGTITHVSAWREHYAGAPAEVKSLVREQYETLREDKFREARETSPYT